MISEKGFLKKNYIAYCIQSAAQAKANYYHHSIFQYMIFKFTHILCLISLQSQCRLHPAHKVCWSKNYFFWGSDHHHRVAIQCFCSLRIG